MSALPTLADLCTYEHVTTIESNYTREHVTAALHAGGFTIPCDECKGVGEVHTWNIRLCPRCAGSGVLPVGILPAPVDEDALRPWSFIADGDLDYANHEDHRYGVKLGLDHYWCAGCLARAPREFTADRHAGWPNLVSAPNGMRVLMRLDPPQMARRPMCPLREAGVLPEVKP